MRHFVFVFVLVLLFGPGCRAPEEGGDSVDIAAALSSGDLACYARADRPVPIEFPTDLGPHNDFKTEWWYYTGNVTDPAGRHFGFQLTFFRQALACETPPGSSGWRTRQLYLAHFAVTDTQGATFYAERRMNRESLGIAGANAVPFRVFLDDWSAGQIPGKNGVRLLAQGHDSHGAGAFGIDLFLEPTKPVIRQGKNGWSLKGSGPSDASYYYSFPGLRTKGRVRLGTAVFEVSGRAWFDHEWSTSALSEQTRGWDWFSLSFDEGPLKGTDLMVCLIRRQDGSSNGYGFGSLSLADGRVVILKERDFSLTVQKKWKSPATGKTYPSGWQLVLPDHDIRIHVDPVLADQEHRTGFAYWEGAVRFTGGAHKGAGYVEMTGY